ncbi:MAG: hypothetical protein VKL20_04990 [Synechocystis sp.]|nr:hypothetical protein [Synechocystis sp.]
MAIIALKAWYLERYQPLKEVVQRPPDLRLNRNSLLKSGLRADFLDDSLTVQGATWFERYLVGEAVQFYIEGSGSYTIANLDLVSQEIYFTKQDNFTSLDPVILLAGQTHVPAAHDAIQAVLTQTLRELNQRAHTEIRWQPLPRFENDPLRLTDSQLRPIRKCLLLLVDVTAIAATPTQTLADPLVCAELGYGLHCKKPGQIILLQHQPTAEIAPLAFDVANHHQLTFQAETDLAQTLPPIITTALQPFNLLR